jgi:hypothetical protein
MANLCATMLREIRRLAFERLLARCFCLKLLTYP